MKKLLTIATILLSGISLLSQEEIMLGEIHIRFQNTPQSWAFTVKLESNGTTWDQYHNITTNFPGGEVNYSSNMYPLPYYHASDADWHYQGYDPPFSLGLYKVSIYEGNVLRAWCFLDYRTADFPGGGNHSNPDVRIDYDVTNKYFDFTGLIGEFIVNGTYYPLWEIQEDVDLITEGLEDYWENCLAAISNSDDHPYLVWGPYPGEQTITEVTYYEIWRKYGSGNWTYLDYMNGNTFTYEDDELTTAGQQSGRTVLYKIRAVQTALPENLLSDYSNTASIVISGKDPGKRNFSKYEANNINSIKLFQNYPNPFNPTTTIGYSLSASNQVKIKVYNMLGVEVALLINELKEAGTYSVKFDASRLPSGIYFYNIQIGSYSETLKLVLQK